MPYDPVSAVGRLQAVRQGPRGQDGPSCGGDLRVVAPVAQLLTGLQQ
jgi:hypothetical protein